MREEIRYIADDGTIFDAYEDCLLHEYECELNKVKTKEVQFYDENGNILDVHADNADDVYNAIEYINITSENGIKLLDVIDEYDGTCFDIKSAGFYIYLDDEFVNINDTKFYKTLEIMKKIGLIE